MYILIELKLGYAKKLRDTHNMNISAFEKKIE